MNDKQRWMRECARKIAYPTHTQATIKMRLGFSEDDQVGMHVYACPHCGLYHLGHIGREDQNQISPKNGDDAALQNRNKVIYNAVIVIDSA